MYTTLEELLNADPVFILDHNGYYYIKPKPKDRYDNSVWQVDKVTEKIKYMLLTDIFDIIETAKRVAPDSLKRVS